MGFWGFGVLGFWGFGVGWGWLGLVGVGWGWLGLGPIILHFATYFFK